MKKCLFVLRSAGIGGTATSLSNLLSLFKEKGMDFDVFLFTHDGEFAQRVKNVANLLPEEKILSSIFCTKANLKKHGFISKLIRAAYSLLHGIIGVQKTNEIVFKLSAMRFSGKYDTVVAFQEDTTTEYVRHIKCKNRVAWCHMDYFTISSCSNKDNAYLKKRYSCFDYIACVSNYIRESMIENLDIDPDKISVVYNTIPSEFIKKQALSEQDMTVPQNKMVFVSMGRFVERKRFDRVVVAAKELKERKIEFVWYILGNGEEYSKIEKMINEENLKNEVVLLGSKNNPFPYIVKADCFVMSSTSEGQPMVLNEALILGVPVITTDFPSAREVVGHVKGGIIVPNSQEGLTDGVLEFITNEELRNTTKAYAKEFVYDNDAILKQVLDIINI